MNIFVSTRPGDSKARGTGDVAVSVWASAATPRKVKAIKTHFDFIDGEL